MIFTDDGTGAAADLESVGYPGLDIRYRERRRTAAEFVRMFGPTLMRSSYVVFAVSRPLPRPREG